MLLALVLALLAADTFAETIAEVEDGTGPMPEMIIDGDSGSGFADPRYISPGRLLNSKGKVDVSLYENRNVSFFEALLSLPEEDDCIRVDVPAEPLNDPLPQWKDLASIAEDAHWIVRGRVTGLAPGFSLEHAGTLVRLAPEEWMKGGGDTRPKFVFFPMGEFAIGDKKICATHGQWPPVPELGDEVVLLLRKSWPNVSSDLVQARGPQVIVLKGESVLLPEFLREEHPAFFDLLPATAPSSF